MMIESGKNLCFLLGAPRSGTTWIQRLLQSHPSICGGEESHFFNLFGGPMTGAQKMHDPNYTRRVGPLCYVSQDAFDDILRKVWNDLFETLYSENPDATLHLEKTPFHALNLDQIKQIFPDAKIIFLVRDSRAVASSLVNASRGWGDYWAPDNYHDAAIEWYRHVRAVRNWHDQNPDHPFLQVRYEDALQNTHGVLEQILGFLLPNSADLLVDATLDAFHSNDPKKQDPIGFSRKRGTEGWKTDMSLRGKLVTWRYTRKLMREVGYDISPFN